MNNQEKAQRLMARGVDPREVGNPQVRRIMQNYQREYRKQQPVKPATPAAQPARVPRPRQSSYTWSDGDTLQSVAQQFNTDPQQILAANPAARTLQTGMVISIRT